MNIFKKFYNWITAGWKYQPTVACLAAYIKVGDLSALNYWQKEYVPWTKDIDADDEWQPADVSILKRGGDCEDIAILYYEIIRRWKGWKANIFVMLYTPPPGHAVVYFETPDKKCGWIDGNIYYCKNYHDIIKFYDGLGNNINTFYFANKLGEIIKGLDK